MTSKAGSSPWPSADLRAFFDCGAQPFLWSFTSTEPLAKLAGATRATTFRAVASDGHTFRQQRPAFHAGPQSRLGCVAGRAAGALCAIPQAGVHRNPRLRPEGDVAAVPHAAAGHWRDAPHFRLQLLR